MTFAVELITWEGILTFKLKPCIAGHHFRTIQDGIKAPAIQTPHPMASMAGAFIIDMLKAMRGLSKTMGFKLQDPARQKLAPAQPNNGRGLPQHVWTFL